MLLISVKIEIIAMTKRKTIEEIMIMIDVNMIMKTEIENMVVVVMVGIN
jgi:hypothetical protein